MSDVSMSFASLVKGNNGLFKSEKQANFLLSQCQEDNVYITGGSVHGNSYNLFYHCDAQGVTKVVKSTRTKADTTTWERKSDDAHQATLELKAKAQVAGARLTKIIKVINNPRLTTSGMANVWVARLNKPGMMVVFGAIYEKRTALKVKLDTMFHDAMDASTKATDAWFASKK